MQSPWEVRQNVSCHIFWKTWFAVTDKRFINWVIGPSLVGGCKIISAICLHWTQHECWLSTICTESVDCIYNVLREVSLRGLLVPSSADYFSVADPCTNGKIASKIDCRLWNKRRSCRKETVQLLRGSVSAKCNWETIFCGHHRQWRSNGVDRVGKVQGPPSARAPEFRANNFLQIIFPLQWKLGHLDIKHFNVFIATLST